MKPPTAAGREECLAVKLAIREQISQGSFIVDAFADAAKRESIDLESASDGGLIGERIKQGMCREPELDRACFCSPLGQVVGPLQTQIGWHLVLVEERIGLEMFDSGMVRVIPQPRADGSGVDSVLAPADPAEEQSDQFESILSLLGFVAATWIGSELLSNWAASIDLGEMAARVS